MEKNKKGIGKKKKIKGTRKQYKENRTRSKIILKARVMQALITISTSITIAIAEVSPVGMEYPM